MADNTDRLTGVLVADAFKREVSALLEKGRHIALLLLDLDSFGRLNEALGRESGDKILVSIVDSIRNGLRKEDIIGRTGGDEFFMCITDIAQLSAVEKIAKNLCMQAKRELSNGKTLYASVGIVPAPGTTDDVETLYEKARKAMLCAKQKGGNGYVFYEESLESEAEGSTVPLQPRDTRTVDSHLLITYKRDSKTFWYPEENALFVPTDMPLWTLLETQGVSSQSTAQRIHEEIEELTKCDNPQVHFTEYYLKNREGIWHWYRAGFVSASKGSVISITFTDINDEILASKSLVKMAQYDELTGLLNRSAFCRTVDGIYDSDPEGMDSGRYSIIYFDISRFKAINDLFGMEEGDRLLQYIADIIQSHSRYNDASCRISSDKYVLFINNREVTPEEVVEQLFEAICSYDLPFEVTFNAGIYITSQERISCEAMIDRAILAQSSIKGSYTIRCKRFTESLRHDMLGEQEIVGMMRVALANKQFVLYYQPQYNHSTGMLVGAEALVRWQHPEKGLISPGIFIPIFEKNGFITQLDLYVFEEVCIFLRNSIDNKDSIVPVSTNFSRYDIYLPDFVERLEQIRQKYDIPVNYLRIELTESAVFGSSQHANSVIEKLHSCGYFVEMDDFGSGYSSLNVLKDIELDTIKLDMQFLREEKAGNKGGTILSSIVRMAKWLNIPVIAEGVEHVEQADFLRSIGCDYIQGYLYSRPLPEAQYKAIVSGSNISATVPQMNLIETFNANNFWDPKSLETLIFSHYVGGACIFEFDGENVEVLRVNNKYLQELCMNLCERDLIEGNPLRFMDEKNKAIYVRMLECAIETGEEQECETLRNIVSECCGNELFIIRSNVRMIGKSGKNHLFYAMIRNVTNERKQYDMLMASDIGFKTVTEQINIYFWEYNIVTKEMKPCFRCMRDLGLPPLVKNYPEPLVDKGIIPQQYAQEYREFLKQLETGAKTLEGDFALTPDLIPFRFRYTTEFDENGHPIKAYASATLIRE